MMKILLSIAFQVFVVLFAAAQIPAQNLILHLTFDDQQLTDESIYNHTVIDHFTSFTDGINDNGLLLDQSSAFLEIPHVFTLEIPAQLTISLWYRHQPQNTTLFYPLVEQSANEFDGHSRYGIWLFGNNALWACIEPDNCPGTTQLCQRCVSENTTLVEGEWYHIAATYDRQTLKLFLNGEIINQRTDAVTGISVRQNALTIGRDIFDSSNAFLKGGLDEIKIYNIALEDAQINDLFKEFSVSFTRTILTQEQFKVFPNPSTGYIKIDAPFSIEKIWITDARGEKIGAFDSIRDNTFEINNLSVGVYFVQFENQGNVYSNKVLVLE